MVVGYSSCRVACLEAARLVINPRPAVAFGRTFPTTGWEGQISLANGRWLDTSANAGLKHAVGADKRYLVAVGGGGGGLPLVRTPKDDLSGYLTSVRFTFKTMQTVTANYLSDCNTEPAFVVTVR